MSDRGDGLSAAAGGPARHHPVLREEALHALRPLDGGCFVDGTFGAGGYTEALLAFPDVRVIGLDRDPDAVAAGRARFAEQPRLALREARFSRLGDVLEELGVASVDGVVLDIGVSSMQIDQPDRGFSFRHDGPLDMRMSRDGPSAADIVNTADEETLADILFHFGEERAARRIAKAIAYDRRARPFTTTRQLAEMIGRVTPGKPGEIHPATRSFQALRVAVNDELGELALGLAAAERNLVPGGRLVVVTFHSLEDRIVKRFLQSRSGRAPAGSRHQPGVAAPAEPTFRLDGKQPVAPRPDELVRNPRSRSAKLRCGVRTEAAPRGLDRDMSSLVELPVRKGG